MITIYAGKATLNVHENQACLLLTWFASVSRDSARAAARSAILEYYPEATKPQLREVCDPETNEASTTSCLAVFIPNRSHPEYRLSRYQVLAEDKE